MLFGGVLFFLTILKRVLFEAEQYFDGVVMEQIRYIEIAPSKWIFAKKQRVQQLKKFIKLSKHIAFIEPLEIYKIVKNVSDFNFFNVRNYRFSSFDNSLTVFYMKFICQKWSVTVSLTLSLAFPNHPIYFNECIRLRNYITSFRVRINF